jgi:hypothetical protein
MWRLTMLAAVCLPQMFQWERRLLSSGMLCLIFWWKFTVVWEVFTASNVRGFRGTALMIVAVSTTETSVSFYHNTRRNVTEELSSKRSVPNTIIRFSLSLRFPYCVGSPEHSLLLTLISLVCQERLGLCEQFMFAATRYVCVFLRRDKSVQPLFTSRSICNRADWRIPAVDDWYLLFIGWLFFCSQS